MKHYSVSRPQEKQRAPHSLLRLNLFVAVIGGGNVSEGALHTRKPLQLDRVRKKNLFLVVAGILVTTILGNM